MWKVKEEKERKASEESKQLDKHAKQLEKLLNNDFQSLQLELAKIRRMTRLKQEYGLDEIIPNDGLIPSDFVLGGPEHGEGSRGEITGPGEIERPGASLLKGKDKGSPGSSSEKKGRLSSFHVEYRHQGEASPRSYYDKETRTIIINLDHPQVARSIRDYGDINSKQFREITYEIAFVEYAIALGYERTAQDEFYTGSEALYDIGFAINRLCRIAIS